jgi:DNA-directed RNA polymerase specialized sigma24 family protein
MRLSGLRRAATDRGDASFSTWVLTIAWRRALTRRRRNLWWLRRDPTIDLAYVADRGAGPEDQAVFGDLRRNLRRLIADLRPRLRDVLLLEQVVNTATRRLPRWSVARSEP